MAEIEQNAWAIAHAFFSILAIFGQIWESFETLRKPSWMFNECFCNTFVLCSSYTTGALRFRSHVCHNTKMGLWWKWPRNVKLLFWKSYIRQMYCKNLCCTARKVSWKFQSILSFGQKWAKLAEIEQNAWAIAHAFFSIMAIFGQIWESFETLRKPSWMYNECFCNTFVLCSSYTTGALRFGSHVCHNTKMALWCTS